MNNLSRRLLSMLLIGLLTLTLFGCGARKAPPDALSGTISASGSTAILPLVSAAKELFEEKHAGITVNVSGGGAFNGMAQVASGAVDIGNSDVPLPEKYANDNLVDHRIAVSPFLIVTNNNVTVTDLPLKTVAAILRGEITNWQEVGGLDQPVTVVSRQQSSGSRATIVTRVLQDQGDISRDALVMDSNGKVAAAVTSTPGAIGYVDAPYFKPDQMKSLMIDGVAYSPEAVIDGRWTIFAFGHMYTKGEATGLTKLFLEFVLSPEFQEGYVEQLGFIPISKLKQQ